jgi:hypothetical protein
MKPCRAIIFPVVLYGCETWSLTLREEHRLKVFENRVLRRIYLRRRKWQEAGEDCIMRSFVTCICSTRMRWAEHVAHMGEM